MKKNINIAVVGLGNIGIYLLNEINSKRKNIELLTGKKINISAVSAKNINKKRKFKFNKKIFYKNPLNIFKEKKIDILFECIGSSDGMSKKIVEKAIKNRSHVITPNKSLIAKHGNNLSKLAEKYKVNLEFEASVCGGIPILRTIKEGLSTNKLNKVYGILNGTSNYILSEMESTKDTFENVLKKAQTLGYAEPGNATPDLNGSDAMSKVKILSSLAFNNQISNHKCLMQGIEDIESKDFEIADQLNLKIKLLGITEIIDNKLFERVHPCLVSKNTYIGNVNGVMNAVILLGRPVGETVLQGEGAGPGPTSSALMSDLLSILRGNIKYPFCIPHSKRKKISVYDVNKYSNSLYLRFEVKDKPGVLSQITKQLAIHKISIQRLIQIPNNKKKTASIVIVTHKAQQSNSNKCLLSLNLNKNILKKPVLIRLF